MDILEAIPRLACYFTRHGFWETLHRTGVSMRRLVSLPRTVIFYRDLPHGEVLNSACPHHLSVERMRSQAEIDPRDLHKIVNFWNPELAHQRLSARFANSASLWLIRSYGELAGFGWTSEGRTMQPHFVPLGNDDVHMFDFVVFPEYRGQGINPALVGHIVTELTAECKRRAYIEAAEWNLPQLRSLGKTGFQRLGVGRKLCLFRWTFVQWCTAGSKSNLTGTSLRNDG